MCAHCQQNTDILGFILKKLIMTWFKRNISIKTLQILMLFLCMFSIFTVSYSECIGIWKIKFGLKIQRMLGEIIEFFIIKTNKEASTVLCSVVKHLGSGRALKKWGKTLDCVSCFPLHFFRALPLPKCVTTEQSAVEASLFVN